MPFSLEKRIPLALVAAILLQTGGALIWAGAASQRLTSLEQMNVDKPLTLDRITRLEEQSGFVRDSLIRIEARLDRLLEATEEAREAGHRRP